jgi:CIC family chloride channel protein
MTAPPPSDGSRPPLAGGSTRGWRNDQLRDRFDSGRDRLAALGRRSGRVFVLASLTGGLTGLAVAGFEWVTREQLFDHLQRQPLYLQVLAPLVGLLLAAALLRYLARGASPATADEYVHNFHEQGRRLDLRPLPGRVLASIATLGFGGAMGYEGPSIYLGAGIGSFLQGKFTRFFSRADAKVLLVAGAAAGVSAIFKAPATGLVFALEVPYREDLARHMLLPAGIASASSYVVFAAFYGTSPLIPVSGAPPFNFLDLAGALLLGAVCGIGARLFTRGLVRAKRLVPKANPWLRASLAGLGLGCLAALADKVFGRPLILGPGYDNLLWAFNPNRAVALVALLLVMRAAATVLTVGGGGAGGLFIPLVIEGALTGRILGGVFRTAASGSNFFPLIGVAAFLGAGYRVPLAGVVFVAEASGRPGFIVPGLIAAMVSQLFMGSASASSYQMAARAGHLERRFSLPLSSALRKDAVTVPPDMTLAEFFHRYALGLRQHAVAVVAGGDYLGVVRVDELAESPEAEWATTTVGEIMRADFPTGQPQWRLGDALRAMEKADVDLLPILDGRSFIGVVTTDDILKLDDILEVTGEKEG